MIALQATSALIALVPALATCVVVARDVRRHPIPTETYSEIAYREGRQCCTAFYPPGGGYPDRCVYPQDHYGECTW